MNQKQQHPAAVATLGMRIGVDGVGRDTKAKIIEMTPDYCIAEGLDNDTSREPAQLYAVRWSDVILLDVQPDPSLLRSPASRAGGRKPTQKGRAGR